ncbi:MAG TPA: hypothetical protein VFA94_17090 [Acidimicrobiales bacterium]|nr:hypothetical protein [Acidimicrobiales bacterium]
MKKAFVAGLVGLMAGGGLLVPQLAMAAGAPPPAPANCPAGVTPIVSGTQAALCVGTPVPVTAGPVTFTGGALDVGATTTNGPSRLCASPVTGPGGLDTSTPVGAYVVLDGNNTNVDPVNNSSSGYVGASNYESNGTNSACPNQLDPTTNNNGGGTNSGGYVGVKGGPYLPVPLVVCGNTSGNQWGNDGRDGCAVP